jgi:hypothetical protein
MHTNIFSIFFTKIFSFFTIKNPPLGTTGEHEKSKYYCGTVCFAKSKGNYPNKYTAHVDYHVSKYPWYLCRHKFLL